MAGLTDVDIINMALSAIPADPIDTRATRNKSAREINRCYDFILKLCLRRATVPWNFATTRIQLTHNSNTPVNEFQYEYDLPGNLISIQQVYPVGVPYRKEGGKLYTNAGTIILKYTNDAVLTDASLMEVDFAEFFALRLAAQVAPVLSEDPNAKGRLLQEAEAAYRHASSAMSMEDTPDVIPDGPWIESHEGIQHYSRRTDGLLDWGQLP